jgi:hypothetical protein
MQRETQKEWWQLKTLPPSLDISQHNRNLDEIGRYIILILKNPFKDKKKKMLNNIILLYRCLP